MLFYHSFLIVQHIFITLFIHNTWTPLYTDLLYKGATIPGGAGSFRMHLPMIHPAEKRELSETWPLPLRTHDPVNQ